MLHKTVILEEMENGTVVITVSNAEGKLLFKNTAANMFIAQELLSMFFGMRNEIKDAS